MIVFRRFFLAALAGMLFMGGCDATTDSSRIVAGVDLDLLFADPVASELTVVADEWAGRIVRAENAEWVDSYQFNLGGTEATVHVIAHGVEGLRHYGAVVVPEAVVGARETPVVLYLHGGDAGVNLEAELPLAAASLGNLRREVVFVVPSFRSEVLIADGQTRRSAGSPSPWDRDVDDTLALLAAARELVPEVSSGPVAALGVSRGGGVALLAAIREPEIRAVVTFFGPTDFFGEFVQEVVEQALRGSLRPLPGLAHLDETVVQPLRRGELSMEQARRELIRRSPVLFAERLPDVQVHHGNADLVVPVSQAESLIRVMRALGRSGDRFESYLYPNGTHSPFTLPGSFTHTSAFLEQRLAIRR
jgi:dipeptidyl aminopeptidase/acylaminoacyl peptidase